MYIPFEPSAGELDLQTLADIVIDVQRPVILADGMNFGELEGGLDSGTVLSAPSSWVMSTLLQTPAEFRSTAEEASSGNGHATLQFGAKLRGRIHACALRAAS